jgi:hypothetical protein
MTRCFAFERAALRQKTACGDLANSGAIEQLLTLAIISNDSI